jgi:hypothetical protein
VEYPSTKVSVRPQRQDVRYLISSSGTVYFDFSTVSPSGATDYAPGMTALHEIGRTFLKVSIQMHLEVVKE